MKSRNMRKIISILASLVCMLVMVQALALRAVALDDVAAEPIASENSIQEDEVEIAVSGGEQETQQAPANQESEVRYSSAETKQIELSLPSIGNAPSAESESQSLEEQLDESAENTLDTEETEAKDEEVAKPEREEPEVEGAMRFSQLFVENKTKNFEQLVEEKLLHPELESLLLTMDMLSPVVFTGIEGMPENVEVNIEVGEEAGVESYLAIGADTIVKSIVAGGENHTIGAIVVLGTAESVVIKDGTYIQVEKTLSVKGEKTEWIDGVNSEKQNGGVAIGAFNGGKITDKISIGNHTTLNTMSAGFLGCIIGAYRNAMVGNIIVGEDVHIEAGEAQCAIGANENANTGEIVIGAAFSLCYNTIELVAVGAASGLPYDQGKPSTVEKITMRQDSSLKQNIANAHFNGNVAIGAERGSSVTKILLEENELIDKAESDFVISGAFRVYIGGYMNAKIGLASEAEAIVFRNFSLHVTSRTVGQVMVGGLQRCNIYGNVVLYNTNFLLDAMDVPMDVALGIAENSHIHGTLKLHGVSLNIGTENLKIIFGQADKSSSMQGLSFESHLTIALPHTSA